MKKENIQNLSLTKKDMYYLMNKKKIEKNAKIFNILSSVSKFVVGAGLGVVGVLSQVGLVTPMILALGGTSFCVVGIGTMLGNISAKQNKKECDEVLDNVKLIVQQQCPERLIDGASLKMVRSNNVVRNLKNYSFEYQFIMNDGEKVIEPDVRDDLQIGTVSRQYIFSDIEGVIGAIEETKISDIERVSTEKGSSENVVTRFIYNWVPTSEIRPYDVDKCNVKSRRK